MVNLRFWRPKERFLLLQLEPKKASALLLNVDEEKNITLEKKWDNFPFAKYCKSGHGKLFKRKLVVSADPTLAAVSSFPVELRRDPENFPRPISAVELENLLSQEIGRVFNRYRSEAAAKLGLAEMETVLVGSEADNFKIDNHLVLNPLAFQGKSVKAVLRLTFTARSVFEPLKNLFGARDFFFTTSPRASLLLLSRIYPPPINLVVAKNDGADCFILDKAAWGNSFYERKLDWSLGSVSAAISSRLAVSPAAASELYGNYLNGDMSDNFYRMFGKIVRPEIENLISRVKKSAIGGRIFLHSPVRLPPVSSARHRRFVFDALPFQEAVDESGFKPDLAGLRMPPDEAFTRLAPFFEFYYDKSNSEINRRLNRRLHWLAG